MNEPGEELLDCELVDTRAGARAVRDRRTGELMHPVVGPRVEAERLYLSPSRLCARLAEPSAASLVLLDVGLGAASNAIAAFSAATEVGGRRLELWSFDRSLGALRAALAEPEAFGFTGPALTAALELAARGEHDGAHARWRFVRGELPASLGALPDACADVVFWDPFSPRSNPELWGIAAFAALRRVCRPGAAVFTYSGATATRSALLLAGFAVGLGASTGEGKRATVAQLLPNDAAPTQIAEVATPLDARWLERLARSSAPFPADAPADALERVRRAAQFVHDGAPTER